ncbi:Protein yceI precursor [Salmonella enterica subsp. enterica]|uniref:Protein yceI n=1 Tax=Salmonella enterica I TaxID=59201 RepID=A0A447MUA2_SALET|nr:Protein yceI precursor [Salmonella enterica subsp. enterica]
MKKNLLGFTLASLLFTTGSAVAAEYKIDKEGQHAFVNFRIQPSELQLAIRHL